MSDETFKSVGPHRKIYKQCAPTIGMVYTEIKLRNNKKYYYRVQSLRQGNKFKKLRIYLGRDLSKLELQNKEKQADKQLLIKKKKEKLKSLDEIISKIKIILKKHNVKKAGLFGSFAKGEQKRYSDIDILIKPPKKIGFGFVNIQLDLEKNLEKKVDLLSYGGINPHIKDKILSEEVKII